VNYFYDNSEVIWRHCCLFMLAFGWEISSWISMWYALWLCVLLWRKPLCQIPVCDNHLYGNHQQNMTKFWPRFRCSEQSLACGVFWCVIFVTNSVSAWQLLLIIVTHTHAHLMMTESLQSTMNRLSAVEVMTTDEYLSAVEGIRFEWMRVNH